MVINMSIPNLMVVRLCILDLGIYEASGLHVVTNFWLNFYTIYVVERDVHPSTRCTLVFEMPSFTHSKHMMETPKFRNGSRLWQHQSECSLSPPG